MTKQQDVERRIMARRMSLGHLMEQLIRAIGNEDWGMARVHADAIAVVCAELTKDANWLADNMDKGGAA